MVHVNELILDLVETGHPASEAELSAIIADVAKAPFATYQARVPNSLRRLMLQLGKLLPPKLSSADIHLLKRVHEDQQWLTETTTVQYIADLHTAISHIDVKIWTYRYANQPFIGFMAPSHVQNVPKPEPYIFVAYSPQYGTLTTGYQASAAATVFTEGYTNLVQHK